MMQVPLENCECQSNDALILEDSSRGQGADSLHMMEFSKPIMNKKHWTSLYWMYAQMTQLSKSVSIHTNAKKDNFFTSTRDSP